MEGAEASEAVKTEPLGKATDTSPPADATVAAKEQPREEAAAVPRPEEYTVLTEGKASILQQKGQDAFYNPAQVVNRDISIAVLRQFVKLRRDEIDRGVLKPNVLKNAGPKCSDVAALAEKQAGDPRQIRVLEGLAASGLRAIRYAMEVDGIARVDANDVDKSSVESIQRNVQHTGHAAADKVRTTQSDARVLMLQRGGLYDAVDLDPYGSPAQLLDSAVQAVSEGGLLMVTATDMAVLCGNHGEACYAKYGSYPLHRAYCHEMALRIMLASLQTHAARHKRIITPMVSLSIDFYIRIFVRVHTSPGGTKDAAHNLAYVYQSTGCDSFYSQRVGRREVNGKNVKHCPGRGPAAPESCPETGSAFNVGGPFWAEQLHDRAFVEQMLQQIQANKASYPAHQKLQSLLTTVLEELPDVILYYSVHDMSKLLKIPPPSHEAFRSALVNAGFRVSSTHANPLGVKTDAPPAVVWDVMRAWARQRGAGGAPKPGSVAEKILGKEPGIEVSFSRAPGAVSASKLQKVTRFPSNPAAHWGPKRKHTRQAQADEAPSKRLKANGHEMKSPENEQPLQSTQNADVKALET